MKWINILNGSGYQVEDDLIEAMWHYLNLKIQIINLLNQKMSVYKMCIDFKINNYNTFQEFIDNIVWGNNNFRPSYTL